MATAHLIFGRLGVGKTTLAKRLEDEHDAVRFSHDAWMARLIGEDSDAALFADRHARVAALMMPATLSIITNAFPPQERGKAIFERRRSDSIPRRFS